MTSQRISWGNLPAGIGSGILDCCDLESALALIQTSKGNLGLCNTRCFYKVILRDCGEHVEVDAKIDQLRARVRIVKEDFKIFKEIAHRMLDIHHRFPTELFYTTTKEVEQAYLEDCGIMPNPRRKDFARIGYGYFKNALLITIGFGDRDIEGLDVPFDADTIKNLEFILRRSGGNVDILRSFVMYKNRNPLRQLFNKEKLHLWGVPNEMGDKFDFFKKLFYGIEDVHNYLNELQYILTVLEIKVSYQELYILLEYYEKIPDQQKVSWYQKFTHDFVNITIRDLSESQRLAFFKYAKTILKNNNQFNEERFHDLCQKMMNKKRLGVCRYIIEYVEKVKQSAGSSSEASSEPSNS